MPTSVRKFLWTFTLLSGDTYALNQLTNRTGQSVNFTWNAGRALAQVTDAGTNTVLLTLAYDSKGKLATATDAYNRQVVYTFSTPSGTDQGMLQTVSQVVAAGTANPPIHWAYAYTPDKGQQLYSTTVPSPTGSGTSTATINYNANGKVASLVDANGNQRGYTYNASATQVQVKDPAGSVVMSWTQKYSAARRNTGVTDANNQSTTIEYNDAQNPTKPTRLVDKNGKVTVYTYDSFGNVLTVTTPRGMTTTYTYDYATFALGRLQSVQEGTKPATTFTYYEPSGLVQSLTAPAPGGGPGAVTTSLTYDSLGNVLSVTEPGNNVTSAITTTYNYTTDGTYTQAAKRGQPLTVTDNLGHTTHLRYDAHGRVTSATDALGFETGASYNLVGQLEAITLPATAQTGTGRGRTVNAYLYVGGPVTTSTIYDESNVQVRQVTRGYGLEGELLSVTGSTEPVSYTYDALYRLKTLKDGNNNTTTYSYNSVGLVAQVQMPGGERVQFPAYDLAGNLLQRIDGNGITTNYLYTDAERKLTDIQYPATPSLNVHFGYDSYGRSSSMIDSSGSQSYTGLSAQTISYGYYPVAQPTCPIRRIVWHSD